MSLVFSSIADRGIPGKERIVLKADAATDVGEYAVFQTGVEDGSVTTALQGAFWFPDKEVAQGDYVILYTRGGVQSERVLKSGKKSHFFYWGRTEDTLWRSTNHALVVLHVDKWISHIPDENA
jgi:hypothetical protein